MVKQPLYTIPSFKIDFFFLIVIFAIILPIIGFLSWSIIQLPGILVLLVFWLLFLWSIVKYFKSRNERVEISDTGTIIYQHGKIVSFDWNEIEKIGFQALVSQRLGMYEIYPNLAIKLIVSSKLKIEAIVSSKEYRFIRKTGDLKDYIGKEEKYDLYINISFLKENDKGILDFLDFLSTKQAFIKSISPLIKTNSQEEYDKIVSENFKSN